MSNQNANENEQPHSKTGLQIILDSQINQFESLLSAALLAKKLNVQLQGLFIEEENLIRAANLSLSREVSLWSAEERQISGESITRIMRAYARHQKKALEKVALEKNIACSFVVVRGEKDNWIKENGISESQNSPDILFIGGHDFKAKVFKSFQYCSEVTPPLISLFSGSTASEHALKVALQMTNKDKRSVHILLLVDELSEGKILKIQLDKLLINHPDIALKVELILKKQVIARLCKQPINILISPTDLSWNQDETLLDKLIHRVNCPIVLVR